MKNINYKEDPLYNEKLTNSPYYDETEFIWETGEYCKNCKDCKDKYTNPIENKLYSSLNELIAKVHGTADIIENLTSEVNDLYDSYKSSSLSELEILCKDFINNNFLDKAWTIARIIEEK